MNLNLSIGVMPASEQNFITPRSSVRDVTSMFFGLSKIPSFVFFDAQNIQNSIDYVTNSTDARSVREMTSVNFIRRFARFCRSIEATNSRTATGVKTVIVFYFEALLDRN